MGEIEMKRIFGAAAVFALALSVQQATVRPAAAQNNTVGGAIVGGVLGGVIGGAATGRPEGALVGAVIGGAAGAAIGSQSERRHGHYYYQNDCYRRVRGGYVRVSRRYC
jgi:outer membrane lipoprotein SlyB